MTSRCPARLTDTPSARAANNMRTTSPLFCLCEPSNRDCRTWLRDIGSVLELYTYKCCLDAGVFSDVSVSVVVDWKEKSDVSNEIDVMAAKGVTPFFISCKTSDVRTEALNELAILRSRFGGEMARAAIVTTQYANATIRHRALELKIDVIDLTLLEENRLRDSLISLSR